MSKHVIVISEDALVYEDTLTLRELPVFGSVSEGRGSRAAYALHLSVPDPSLPYLHDDRLLS